MNGNINKEVSMPRPNVLSISALVLSFVFLTSCGGGGGGSAENSSTSPDLSSSTTPQTNDTTISGRVIDGYLSNAKVCIDKNDNLQKRTLKQIQHAQLYSTEKLSSELLMIMDSLEAANNLSEDPNLKLESLIEGNSLLLKTTKEVFEKLGIEEIYPLNDDFDPESHQAMATKESEADENKVLALACNDKQDPFYYKLNENLEILKTEKDADGRRLEVIEIEMSYKRLIPDDDEPSSYINFYIANGGIVMPSFDDEKADIKAQNIIKSVFPKRKILALNGIDISLGGGNIHCITQQQPLSIQQ